MSLNYETIILDPEGDLFLVFERPDEIHINHHTTYSLFESDAVSQGNPADVVPLSSTNISNETWRPSTLHDTASGVAEDRFDVAPTPVEKKQESERKINVTMSSPFHNVQVLCPKLQECYKVHLSIRTKGNWTSVGRTDRQHLKNQEVVDC